MKPPQMKCTVCRGPAEIRLPRHNAKFCVSHFNAHIHRQIENAVRKYRMFEKEDTLLLAVSGGKDSMGAWHALSTLGYRLFAVHINNGFGEFSERSEAIVRDYGQSSGMPFRVYSFAELFGYNFDEVIRRIRVPACSLCGTAKRYFLNRIAGELGYPVLATGHNLDDENAFLLGNLMYGKIEYLDRQYPVLAGNHGFVKKTKPLTRLTDRDMRLYAEVNGIPFLAESCPRSEGANSHYFKKVMDMMNRDKPGLKGCFHSGFMDKIHPRLVRERESEERDDGSCTVCGYRTLKGEKCLMCTIHETMGRESEEMV